MLGVSIGLNAVSSHGTCTAVFVAVAAITGFAFASIRTLGKLSWLAWIGLCCIVTSGMLQFFNSSIAFMTNTMPKSSSLQLQLVYKISQLLSPKMLCGCQTISSSTSRASLRPFPPSARSYSHLQEPQHSSPLLRRCESPSTTHDL